MNSITVMFLFAVVVVALLLAINFILAPRNPYLEKTSTFECGLSSFTQTRSQFHLSFFMYAIIFILLDLELVLLYPYAMSTYHNESYGLVIMLIFTLIISIGFIYELCSGVLHIDSRQYNSSSSTYNFANLPKGSLTVATGGLLLESHIFKSRGLTGIVKSRLSLSIRRSLNTISPSITRNKF